MLIDQLKWLRTLAIFAIVVACGCQQFSSSRRSEAADPFTEATEPPPENASGPPVRAVTYDEREDYRVPALPESEDDLGVTDFSLGNIEGTVRRLSGRGPDSDKAKELYQQAEGLFEEAVRAEPDRRAARLNDAAEIYSEAALRWPDSALEEDALMMVGECRYFADHYPKAEDAYEVLIKRYPNTEHMDTIAARRFSLAKWWLARHKKSPRFVLQPNLMDKAEPTFDTFGRAVRMFDQIRLDDPTGKLADDATMAAAGAYFETEKYRNADRFYEDLRKSFPNSPHQFRAHLLGVMCKLRIYQGPDYNGKPLDDAEKLIEQIYRQFPTHVVEEREHLEKAFAEIRARKAERRHYYAKYYERRGEYGGARYYYGRIIEEYPNTSLAELAQSRVSEISDRPDRPPQKLEWLVDWIPEPKPAQALLNYGDEHPVTRFLYDPMSIARGTTDGTNSHLR